MSFVHYNHTKHFSCELNDSNVEVECNGTPCVRMEGKKGLSSLVKKFLGFLLLRKLEEHEEDSSRAGSKTSFFGL